MCRVKINVLVTAWLQNINVAWTEGFRPSCFMQTPSSCFLYRFYFTTPPPPPHFILRPSYILTFQLSNSYLVISVRYLHLQITYCSPVSTSVLSSQSLPSFQKHQNIPCIFQLINFNLFHWYFIPMHLSDSSSFPPYSLRFHALHLHNKVLIL
jgi:hypothetical protein